MATAAEAAAYRAANPEKVRVAAASRRALHREEARRKTAEWRVANRERARAMSCASYYANADKDNAGRRARYQADRARELVRQAAYRTEHRAEINRKQRGTQKRDRSYDRAYYLANREKRLVQARDWRLANPDVRAHQLASYRARRRQNGGSHTLTEWREKCDLFANLCAYCGEARPLTRDHKTPLSRGGTDDIANILPACKSCNSRKQRKTTAEFLPLLRIA